MLFIVVSFHHVILIIELLHVTVPLECEIHQGDNCTIGGLAGTYNGCTCTLTPQHFITGIDAVYSTTLPLLWGTQYGNGSLMNLTNGVTNQTFLINNSGCIIFFDGSYLCNASTSGGNFSGSSYNETYNLWAYNQTANLSGLVPYTGATTNVNLGVNNITSNWFFGLYNWVIGITTQPFATFNGSTFDLTTNVTKWLYNMSDGSYNSTYDLWAYNQTTTSTSTYNATYNTWAYNQTQNNFYNATYNGIVNNITYLTTYNITYNGIINNASYLTTYNSTYNLWAYNQTITYWNLSGTNLYTGNLGYNVGIGTKTPSHKLEVSSNINHIVLLDSDLSTTSDYNLGGTLFGSNNGLFTLQGVNGSGTGGTFRFVINQSTGHVGIGTATPSQELEVAGNVNFIDGARNILFSPGSGTIDLYGSNFNINRFSTEDVHVAYNGGDVFLTNATSGNVGIGTTNPQAKLEVTGGAVMFNGTTGDTPTSGPGTRFMWIPSKAALRTGIVTATEWDNSNIGIGSFAAGSGTIASGDHATAFGYRTNASAGALSMGVNTRADGPNSFAMGNGAWAQGNRSLALLAAHAIGYYSIAIGNEGTSSVSQGSISIGHNITSDGWGAIAMGSNDTRALSDSAIAIGYNTQALNFGDIAMGNGARAQTGNTAVSIGYGTIASNNYALATGYNTNASGQASFSSGYYSIASGDYSVAMGTLADTNSKNYAAVIGLSGSLCKSDATNQFKVCGDVSMTGETTLGGISSDGTGKVVCVKLNGDLGTCTSGVGVSGTCTCA
jgi:hypothetical protein